MSTDWRIWCLDCEDEHYFCDANHQVELMREIIRAAPAIAAMAPLTSSYSVEIRTSYGGIDPDWFVKHQGHRLVPRSEYGDIEGTCGKRIVCPCCKVETQLCDRPTGHDGSHGVVAKPSVPSS